MATKHNMLHAEHSSTVMYKDSTTSNPSASATHLELPELAYTSGIQKPAAASVANVANLNNDTTYPPPTLDHGHPITYMQTQLFKRRKHIHFAALCWFMFLEGWNDGTPGPLLPTIQQAYHVGFAVVSLMFVLSCVGFISGAFANIWLNDRLGFGKVLVLGAASQVICYAIQSPAPPFPVMVLANAVGGFGMALQNAQANGFVGSLKEHASTKLGFLHASYGLGAFTAPLVATQFAFTPHWHYYYLISLGIAVSNLVVLLAVFKLRTQDEVHAEGGQAPTDAHEQGTERGNKFNQILSLKTVHTLAFFILVYVGTEVSLGGWIVTFIIRERDGGRSAGYISAGFFGGLTLGRVALMWFNRMVGPQKVIFLYIVLVIALELTVWFVPSMIENAVAVAVIGLFLGPMYPLVMTHTAKVLPRWLVTGAIGWIAGFGQAGSAILPFITGVLASKYSISALQPLMVTMMAVMLVLWALVPKSQRRLE